MMNSKILSLIYTEWPTMIMLFLITYIINFYLRYFTRKNPLPGPIPLPFIGNLHQWDPDLANFCEKIRKKYGDISEVYLGSGKYVILSRPDLFEPIYGNFGGIGKNAFLLRTPPSEGLDELGLSYKGILFNRNVHLWKFNRKFVSQTIMTPKFLNQFIKSTQELFEEVENYWNILSENDETKEIQFAQWMTAFASDITIYSTTGKRFCLLANYFNSVVKDDKKKAKYPETTVRESKEFVESIIMRAKSSIYFLIVPRIMRHYLPILSYYNKIHLENLRWLESKLLDLVNEGKREIENTKNNDELTPNILTLLLTTNTDRDLNKITTGEFSRPLTDDEIVTNCNEIFSGGINTTAHSICCIVYHLYHHPEVKKKLLQELDSLNLSSPNQEITCGQVDNLKYLEAIINESSRVTPSVPVFFRCSTEEVTVGNVEFPPDSMFLTNFKGLHTHSQYWERPLEFDPDRFFLHKDKIAKSSYLPFGGGSRYCPGRHWAMIEIKTFITRLYLKYDVELVDKESPLDVVSTPIARCVNLKVLIKKKH